MNAIRLATLSACAATLLLSAMQGIGTARAADEKGRFAVHGLGTLSCADVVRKVDSNAPDLIAVVAWSDGALSAFNRNAKGAYDAMPFNDPPGVFTNLVVNYCRQKPKTLYETAVSDTIEILKPVRLGGGATPLVVRNGDNRVVIYPDVLKRVQVKLVKLGLLSGAPTAKFNEQTSAALANYQTSRKLAITGVPDASTTLTLLLTP